MRTPPSTSSVKSSWALPRARRSALIPPTMTLALWRLRKVWQLMLITELGMVAAVMLICTVPLFSQVAISGGLRSALTADPNASSVNVAVITSNATPDLIRQAQPQIEQILHQNIAPYQAGGPSFLVSTTFPMNVFATNPTTGGASTSATIPSALMLIGRDLSQVTPQVHLLSGRLPLPSTAGLEVALPQATASALTVTSGSMLYLSAQTQAPPAPPSVIPIQVVGVFSPTNAGDVFSGLTSNTRSYGPAAFGDAGYAALTSSDTLLNVWQPLLANSTDSTLGGGKFGGRFPGSQLQLTWRYPMALGRITANDLAALATAYGTVSSQLNNQLSRLPGVDFPYTDGALQVIANYQGRAIGIQIVVIILLLQVLGLVLFFVSMMAGILVERQSEAIALLRSRGAYRRQVFGALTTHGLGMSLLALIIGPLAAIPLVRFVSQYLLDAAGQQGLSVLDGSPLSVAWSVRWFALAAVLCATIAIVIAILRAASRNVLALRRESARSTMRPLWQRLNLDLILAVIAGTGYGLYLFVLQRVDARIAATLSVLSLIAPFFLLLAGTLLFLRFFPVALRGIARLATRRSGATSMLALSQMARAPREFSRMLLLLALSTAFMLFTIIFVSSQLQHFQETVAYRTVSDFSGTLSDSLTTPTTPGSKPPTADQLTSRYSGIAGVRAASVGIVTVSSSNQPPMKVVAVNPNTFAQVAYWSSRISSQPLTTLSKQLGDGRTSGITNSVVPAVVDDALWQMMNLTGDGHFSLSFPGRDGLVNFVAIARVAHLPPVVDAAGYGFGPSGDNGGLMVDYATFVTVYDQSLPATASPLQPNAVWLRTADDPGTLATVRAALTSGDLAVTNLGDRRQQIADIQRDPLQLDIIGTLSLGAGVALLLALIGVWTASWINARSRLTNFAVLRALGTTPRQILSLLVWEQGVVYITALGLGALLGLLLSAATLPSLVFTSLVASSGNGGGPSIDVPPAHVVLPGAGLGIALGALALICGLAIVFTTFAVSRASLGESLRLNQD